MAYYKRKRERERKERILSFTIIILLISLVSALALLFAPKSDGSKHNQYKYDLSCLTELHDNPLEECKVEETK